MDTATAIQFAEIRKGLRPASIAALIDFAEGDSFALTRDPWVWEALLTRGLATHYFDQWRKDDLMGMPHTHHLFDFTELGREWVIWYMQPRDLPAQLDMFDALE